MLFKRVLVPFCLTSKKCSLFAEDLCQSWVYLDEMATRLKEISLNHNKSNHSTIST